MSGRETRMREDTFNLLVAAVVLVVVAVTAVMVTLFTSRASCNEESRRATTVDTPPETTMTYRLDNVRQGPFVIPSEESPWRREEVALAATYTLSPDAFYGKEAPYLTAKPSLRARPEALLALDRLVREMPQAEGVCLRLECGYLDWETAGSAAGISPYHTGYTLRIAYLVDGEGVLTAETAVTHPRASSPAAWLAANLTRHGFVHGRDTSELVYVGVPHAARITKGGYDMMRYIAAMRGVAQAVPATVETEDGSYRIFYVEAEYGIAVIQVSERASVTAVGDGERGFLVTLFYPRG